MVRPTYVEIDLGAIAHNVGAFKELIGSSEVCAVVKADAYGHGDVPVASTAVDAGANMLAVALVEEGVRLRESGIETPILLLSQPGRDGAAECVRWNLQPTAYTLDAIETFPGEATLHIKIDTGMHRVGAEPANLLDLVQAVDRSPGLDLGSVWTHFAVADEDRDFTNYQIEMYDATVKSVEIPVQHLANTAGATLFPHARRDMCRIGLGIYGLHPTPETQDVVALRPAMRLVSHVTHRQRRRVGDRPSYGRVRSLKADANVVTVPVGYADGFVRRLTTNGSALIGGKRFSLAGTVTMDQIVIDVGDEDIDIGEEVILLGSQGEAEISAYEWASELDTISYEVVCSIGPRVPRRFV